MAIRDLTSPQAVLDAIAEYDELGSGAFLSRYGYRPARGYFIVHNGRQYDSKAIAGVAHGYQFPQRGPLKASEFSGGDATVRAVLERLGFTVQLAASNVAPGIPEDVEQERARRQAMWQKLRSLGDPENVTTAQIGEAGIRPQRTGQGIFRDQSNTAELAPPHGVTLTLVDVGETYTDEFDEDGGIYHYPDSDRGGSRDLAEIEATKNAFRLVLPVFVVLGGSSPSLRRVRLGWIADADDAAKQFLVTFAERPTGAPIVAPTGHNEVGADEGPLHLLQQRPPRFTSTVARPGQARFRFRTIKRYGACCALCSLSVESMLEAVHIVGFEHGGADDPRNALVMCRNHHRAFDAGLIAIEADTLAITFKEGFDARMLLVEFESLTHLRLRPAQEALKWRTEHGNKRIDKIAAESTTRS